MTFIRVNSENPANENNEEKIQKIKNNLEINFLYNNIIHDESNILIIG